MSDGTRGGDVRERAAEQSRADEALGDKVVMLRLPEGPQGPLDELETLLEEEMASADPDLVHTHVPRDTRQDHVQTYRAMRIAARQLAR